MRLPFPEYGTDNEQTINNLMDTVVKLRKELEYTMYHLGDENIPDLAGMKGDIKGNHTLIQQTENQITLLASDVAGNTSRIQVQAGQISSLVSSVNGQQSEIIQLSNQITLKVGYGDVISAINLSPESISISASKINLNGVTTMNGLVYVSNDIYLGSSNYDASLTFKSGIRIRGYGTDMDLEAAAMNFNCLTGSFQGSLYVGGNFSFNGYEQPIERGQNVKRIGASDTTLFVQFENGTTKTIPFV